MATKNNNEVPIHEKTILTIQECSALTGIGQNTLEAALNKDDCPFLFKVGRKRMIIRKDFDEYISKYHGIEAVTDKPSITDNFNKKFGFVDGNNYAFVPDAGYHFHESPSLVLGHIFLESDKIFDKKFAKEVKETMHIESCETYNATEIPYGETETLDEHIATEWNMPEYETQRPAGAYIVNKNPVNSIVIASERSGKGQMVIEPSIDVWSRQKKKENIFVNDIRGEHYAKFKSILKMRGYDIIRIDTVRGLGSTKYNPLTAIVKSARKHDFVECCAYIDELTNAIFPIDNKTDPIYPDITNKIFKIIITLLIDLCLEKEELYKYTHENISMEELNQIWNDVTLYHCYQLLLMLTAKQKNPASELDGIVVKIINKLWDEQDNDDLLNVMCRATKMIKHTQLNQMITNEYNALRSSVSISEFSTGAYGVAISEMSIFAEPVFSSITSCSPLTSLDPLDLSYPKRLDITLSQQFLEDYGIKAFNGLKCEWTAYDMKNGQITDELGKEFEYTSNITNNGIASYRFTENINNNAICIKCKIFDKETLIATQLFKVSEIEPGHNYIIETNNITDIEYAEFVYFDRPKAVFLVSHASKKSGPIMLRTMVIQIFNSTINNSMLNIRKSNQNIIGTKYMLDNFDTFFNKNNSMRVETMLALGLGIKQQYAFITNTINSLKKIFEVNTETILMGSWTDVLFIGGTDGISDDIAEIYGESESNGYKSIRDVKPKNNTLVAYNGCNGSTKYMVNEACLPYSWIMLKNQGRTDDDPVRETSSISNDFITNNRFNPENLLNIRICEALSAVMSEKEIKTIEDVRRLMNVLFTVPSTENQSDELIEIKPNMKLIQF